jgi:hypothetical protein
MLLNYEGAAASYTNFTPVLKTTCGVVLGLLVVVEFLIVVGIQAALAVMGLRAVLKDFEFTLA